MRFSTLELLAFGHFSGETLNFANSGGAIDIVYGENEAGKSTSLRAVTSFLFGIPVRTTDDFVHQKPTLRIGAALISSDGESFQLVRRKGAKGTLRDEHDNPVGEDGLERMLSGLDRELFEQMFALSRDGLVSGGNDLLAGRGSLGEALFAASLGLAGINEILHALEEEAAALFKPGGSVPELNASLRELEELRRAVRELELRPSFFLGHQSALDSARAQRETLDGELRRTQSEVVRLERNKQLLPLAALRTQLEADLESLGKSIVLSSTARQERLDALRDQERAKSDIEIAEQRIDGLTLQLDLLRPNPSLLARADEIRELHQEIGAHRKAARDLPGLRSQRRVARDEATALLAQTHPERAIENVDDLRLTVADRTSITSLSEDFGRIDEAARGADRRLAEVRTKLQGARKAHGALTPFKDVSSATAALSGARRLGDIEAAIAEEGAERRAADAQLLADLSALPLFAGDIEDLEALAVPTLPTVVRFESEYERVAMKHRELDSSQARVVAEAAKLRERLQALELAGDVPSEADLGEARVHRKFGWSLVRRTLENDPEVDASEFAGQQPLADAFEISMASADDVADRLRREADRVAARAELEAALASAEYELGELERQIGSLGAERRQLEDEWVSAWRSTGIAPLPPTEMRDWLASRNVLGSAAADQREARGQLEGKLALAAQHRDALTRELQRLGRAAVGSRPLAELVSLVEGAVEELRRKAATAEKALDLISALEKDEGAAVFAAEQAASERASWMTRWATAVAKLALDPDLTPEQVRSVVDALTDLFVKLDQAASFENRIEAIDRDANAFATAAVNIAQDVAPELEALSPEQQVLELERLVNTSQTEAAQAGELRKQLADASTELQQGQERWKSAEAELQRLMNVANCSSVGELEVAEERSATALELRERLKTADEQMTQIGAAPAAALAAEVAGLQLEQLEADIRERVQIVEELGEQRRELDETVGQQRALLNEMSRGQGAADAAVAVEAAKATVREQAEQYARLRLAVAILRREIDKFREESHGPLLARASYFFAKLTCERYSGFTTGFDDRGGVILLGRRKNGAEITVDEMSDGTRDQLYLALRLATIEQQLERVEPLPLIVDDLFVNFDDRRASAGFEVLAELAQKTQVIFFTHHRHLVDLAKMTLEADRWAFQELTTGEAGRYVQAA
jgi:uncharacterized protein YhaN